MFMNTSKNVVIREARQPFFLRLQAILLHSFWTPERDEKHFLAGLPITMFLIPLLWKQGIHPLGSYLVPTVFAIWCMAYAMKFRRRLAERGELKRCIIAPSVFVALILSVSFY
jgi:hypothetical protein